MTDCWGTMTDSDAGLPTGNYSHNEDLIFTICPTAPVGAITLTFTSFQVEQCCDLLRIFQGADTFGTLINSYSGFTIPPVQTVNGCVTLHFKSDGLINGTGWVMDWEINLAPPPSPSITVNPTTPSCSSNSVVATFNNKWWCDSVKTGTFIVASGPMNPLPTVAVTPVNCQNDSSDQYTLTFTPALTANGVYNLQFNGNWLDVCDSVHPLSATTSFSVTDCPLQVVVNTTNDTICPGQTTNLIAVGSGGDPNTYNYTWSPNIGTGPGPHQVSPTTTTTYTCTLSDASAAPSGTGSVTITVLTPPNAQANTTVCQSDAPFNLTATPAGGSWSGFGIINSNNGTFDPDSAGAGTHVVYYSVGGACADSTVITVNPFDAGPTQAACPGSASFNMTGFTPAGGTWSGSPFITNGGVFNPSTGGSHLVTYTLGGCSDTVTVNVANITVQPDDTMCVVANNAPSTQLVFSPLGGVWTGSAGITNATQGWFRPMASVVGTNNLTYTMNGCAVNLTIEVENIQVGGNHVPCVKDAPFFITGGSPAGGYWTTVNAGQSGAILDSLTGEFDVNFGGGGNWNCQVTYNVAGCTRSKWVYPRQVWIGYDTLIFCVEDNSNYTLNWANTNRSPNGGFWSGNGLVGPNNHNNNFNPAAAGIGSHALYYTLGNACYDSLVAIVLGPKNLTDTTVCELEAPFKLKADPVDPVPGETWSGTGIINTFTGMFDPQVAGVGTHQIIYTNYKGCPDTTQVTVTPQDTIYVNGLDPFYCHIDTVVNLTVYPSGGTMIGPSVNDSTFNPIVAGQGTHLLTYTFGSGACQRTTQITTTVGSPIQMQTAVSDDSICLGEYVTLSVNSFGGTGAANHSYTWNNGLSPSFQHLLQPQQTTVYTVTVDDGCSEPVTDTITVLVNQPFQINFDSSAIQCYGETGWLRAIPSVAGNYSYTWSTTPEQSGDTVKGLVSFDYRVRVTDLNTTCYVDAIAKMPGWNRILAKYSTNPAICVHMGDPDVDFLDLTLGSDFGTWYFGDGDTMSFVPGQNVTHTYTSVGQYETELIVSNIGGCKDTFNVEVCVDPIPIKTYNTFSPNGDGYNDFFEIDNIEAYPNNHLIVFNRYGNVVYERNGYANDWPGTNYRTNEPLPDGAYFYIFDKGNGTDKVQGDVVIFR